MREGAWTMGASTEGGRRVAIGPEDGDRVDLGVVGVVWKLEGAESQGRFSVVEHPIEPRALAAPLHRHHLEDEYSFVLEGRLGALRGDEVVEAGPGSWVIKPRGEWHTFWNAGDTPCRIIEVISPAGFEDYFRDLASLLADATDGPPDQARLARMLSRYRLEMDFASVPALCRRFGLVHPLA
jgi:mannose-6-phosphate isomerase-like protein (cupin superfamily)